MTNDKKVAFIICTNDELYYNECVWYIEQLNIPEGYETDIIAIQGAGSMTEAYNTAMDSSDAKYKVYLHQDVFIYNENFIAEILKIFRADEKIGMLGVLGGTKLPQNAIAWDAWDTGCTYVCNFNAAFCVNGFMEQTKQYIEVEAIDGMLMVTQYDIRWRDDLKLGWDFYDVSQSLEFRRTGYKVVVPFQKEPWCMHDCGRSKLTHYDEAREKVLREYKDFFSEDFSAVYDGEMATLLEEIFLQVKECINYGDYEPVLQIKEQLNGIDNASNNLLYAFSILDIYQEEKKQPTEVGSFFFEMNSWEMLKGKYILIKFLLRRLENNKMCDEVAELLEWIRIGALTKEAVWCIAQRNVVHANEIYKILTR